MDEYDIAEAFEAVEEELIASMMRNMKRHRVEETAEELQWSMWQAEQLKALENYKRQNQKRYAKQFQNINRQIDGIIREARLTGNMDQEIEILEAIKKGFKGYQRASETLTGQFFRLNDRKLEALIKATTDDMQKAETAILRMANDKYRQAIFNAQVYANTGAGTYEKAVDMATKDMLSAGLNCVEYKNGARHRLSDYADMAIRTASKRAYLQGEGEKRQEWGISTVIMNKRGNPCPKCLPWVGKVLIDDVWSGGKKSDGPYPLMSKAISAGLYHPRCKDGHTTYFPRVSTADDKWTKKELEAIGQYNRQEAELQYAARQAERFGRLARYSLDAENQKRYAARREEWENCRKSIVKLPTSDIIESGARITDTLSKEGREFAEMYYDEIRNFSTDAKRIAENLGKKESDIKRIKAYLFEEDVLFDVKTGKWRRFDPDCAIAQSWQRLMIGKDIKPHDKTLIEHELLEMQIKKENPGIDHNRAHEMASQKYNYAKEAEEYYGSLKEYKKDGK